MAIYKGLVILEEQKYPKNRVVNCRFLKNLSPKKGTFRAYLGIPPVRTQRAVSFGYNFQL